MTWDEKVQEAPYFKRHYVKTRSATEPARCVLRLQCQECGRCHGQFDFSNDAFLTCIGFILRLERQEQIELIEQDNKILITKNEIDVLNELFDYQKVVHSLNDQLGQKKAGECHFGKTRCTLELLETLKGKQVADLDGLYLADPVEYLGLVSDVRTFLYTNPRCAKCLKAQERLLERVITDLEESRVVKRGMMEKDSAGAGRKNPRFELLNKLLFNLAPPGSRYKDGETTGGSIIDKYYLGGASVLEACVSRVEGQNELLYGTTLHLPFTGEFLSMLKRDVEIDLERDEVILKMERFNDILDRILEITKRRATRALEAEKERDIEQIILLVGFSVLGMAKLFPVLIDQDIEEIFLDSPDGTLYIHHARYQHCRTTLTLSVSDVQGLISRLRMETDKNLNELYPSLKCVIKNKYFYARFNVDVKPLNPSGFSLDIRRLNKKALDLTDLITLGTFNIDIAAFLVFCVHSRLNLTIIGRTDSGKTTLLNALDMLYPQHLRKIYVEDEIETLSQDPARFHQLKFKTTSREKKTDLIKNLLHRSPEVLILGEILAREETEAMFHCLSTGMRGLQTIHASSTSSLITRLMVHFNVPSSCFSDLDFIILLNKYESGARRLVDISEINHVEASGRIVCKALTTYDPKSLQWSVLDLDKSSLMGRFFARTKFNPDILNTYLGALKRVLVEPRGGDEHGTPELIKALNQVYRDYRDCF